MKRIFLMITIFILIAGAVFGETITVDTTGWTQEQKNMMQSAAVSLLAQEGITYKSISVSKDGLEIDSPSKDISKILTPENLKTEGTQIIDTAEQNRQVDIAKEIVKSDELKTNEFSTLDIAEVDNKIDSLSSLDDVKDLLRELLKYIKAKE